MEVLGVSFIDEQVVKWKRKDFIDKHNPIFYQGLEPAERERVLGDIWDKAKGIKKTKKGKKN